MALALSSISTARRRSRLSRCNALCASSFSGPLGGPQASLLGRRLPLLLAPSARPTVSPGLLPWPYAQLREPPPRQLAGRPTRPPLVPGPRVGSLHAP